VNRFPRPADPVPPSIRCSLSRAPTNTLPWFIVQNGPIREARFVASNGVPETPWTVSRARQAQSLKIKRLIVRVPQSVAMRRQLLLQLTRDAAANTRNFSGLHEARHAVRTGTDFASHR
jgi:hypothetical protein